MEMAKVTSKGQITIPITIRKLLNIKEGEKLLFIEKPDGILMVNPDTFQMERFDELSAVQPSVSDEKQTALKPDDEDPAENSQNKPPVKKEETNRSKSGFDVTALLDDIRSMGSKI